MSSKLFILVLCLAAGLSFFLTEGLMVYATETDDTSYMTSGIATVLDPGNYHASEVIPQPEEKTLDIEQKFEKEQNRIGKEYAMANVQNALNIRAQADESSEKVGVLYKDCGGQILEQKEGWTKIKSGNVIGWAKNEYLLTGTEAQAMADEVGNWIATIQTSDAVRVRKAPDMEAEVMGYLAHDDGLDIIEVVNNNWISVEYDNEVAYVSTGFINVRYHIDEGETIEVIRAREREEAERKRKANRGVVDATADELRLLAALIYCEAGNQSYEGQVAVGAVVMNRVKSPAYPNTMHGVIYASGQFTPAMSGKVARMYEGQVPEQCLKAAAAALAGETTVGGATHFRRAGKHDGYVLGDHVFW